MTRPRPALDYHAVLAQALEAGAFGPLDAEEEALIRLRAGGDDPPRTLDEIAVKTGQTREWVAVLEELLVERLQTSSWWPLLTALPRPL